jgi:hypothetical protein
LDARKATEARDISRALVFVDCVMSTVNFTGNLHISVSSWKAKCFALG